MDCKISSVRVDPFVSANNVKYMEIVNFIIQAGPKAVKESKTEEQLVIKLEEKLKVFGPNYTVEVMDYFDQPIPIEYSDLISVKLDDRNKPKYLH